MLGLGFVVMAGPESALMVPNAVHGHTIVLCSLTVNSQIVRAWKAMLRILLLLSGFVVHMAWIKANLDTQSALQVGREINLDLIPNASYEVQNIGS